MSLVEGAKLINYAVIVSVTSSSPRSLHLEKKKRKKKQIGEVVNVGVGGCCHSELPRVFHKMLRSCNEAEDEGGGIR